MRILVLTERFVPEITAPSFRVRDHARVWRALGHDVTVVTCVPNFPKGKVFDGYRNRVLQEEDMEGIRVIRVCSYMTANEGFARRTLDYVSYMASAVLQGRRYDGFDVLLATSPPLFTALGGYLVARMHDRPWAFEIRDLWPASIRAVGASQSRMLDMIERLELFLYRKADRIVSLTRSFKADLISRGIAGSKIDIATNGVDTEEFSPSRATFDARRELGLDDSCFLAGYIGTTGMAHGLETLLDAAELCRDRREMRFLILGEGAARGKLEKLAREKGLVNVTFRDFVPHGEVPSYIKALDVSIIHLRPDPLFRTVIPSKLFEIMAMGVPVLMAVEGESADIVSKAGCGVCIPSGHSKAMAETLLRMTEDRARLQEMGARGRAAIREEYSRRANAIAVLRSLEAAARRHRRWRRRREG